MKSLYKAKIYHKRHLPSENEFTYSGYYIKFYVEKMEDLKSIFFSVNKFNLFSFYEKDHGYRNGAPLKLWAQDMLAKSGILNFEGNVELQTFPRVLGYVFNPVSFWFCREGDDLIAIICEVNNTFGESHTYVLNQKPNERTYYLPKEFHVSPFYDVKGEYEFDFTKKDKVNINYYFDGNLQLCTSLNGDEIKWTDWSLFKLFFRYPFYTFFILILIHVQALKLFLKKNKFYSKPLKASKELTYEHNV